jgi:hypothetical protein
MIYKTINMIKRFRLKARISSDNINAIKPALKVHLPKARIKPEGRDLLIEAELEGNDVKESNRMLLSALRKAEKRTRLRSEWTSEDGTTYYFFDYVLKRTSS